MNRFNVNGTRKTELQSLGEIRRGMKLKIRSQ